QRGPLPLLHGLRAAAVPQEFRVFAILATVPRRICQIDGALAAPVSRSHGGSPWSPPRPWPGACARGLQCRRLIEMAGSSHDEGIDMRHLVLCGVLLATAASASEQEPSQELEPRRT